MAYGDNVRNERNGFAEEYSHAEKINRDYSVLIRAEKDPEKKKALKEERDRMLAADREASNEEANRHIEEVLDRMEAKHTKCTMTPQQLTDHIKKAVPTYQFDCSEENLARQKILHDKALAALRKQEINLYKNDPYSAMGRKVWGETRSETDYGPYIGRFMPEEDKKELEALSKLAEEGKKNDPKFLRRRGELHKRINLHTMSLADQKSKEYANLTTEQMIDRYDEIYTFCRLGDTTNCMSPLLTPEETAAYHKKANRLLNHLGIAMNKVSALASDMGDKMDVEQISQMSKTQRFLIQGGVMEPLYREPVMPGKLLSDPMNELDFASEQVKNSLLDYLEQNYSQFEVKYNTESSTPHASGFDRNMIYQAADGRILEAEEAMDEIMQWHRPVYISTGNDPSAKPVLAYLDNGKPCSGATAEEAFHRQRQEDQKKVMDPYPPLVHKTKLGFFEKAWNGICNAIDKLPFANASPLRTEKMKAYNEETEIYETAKAEYDARVAEYKAANQKNGDLSGEELTGKEKIDFIQKKLFESKPELKQKAAEMKPPEKEQKQPEKAPANKSKQNGNLAEKAGLAVDILRKKGQEADAFKKNYWVESGATGRMSGRTAGQNPTRMDQITALGKKLYAEAIEIASSIRNGDMEPDQPIQTPCLYQIATNEVLRDFYQSNDHTLEEHMETGLGSRGMTKALHNVPEIKDRFDDMTAEKFIETVTAPDFMKFGEDVKEKIKASAVTVKEDMIRHGKAAPQREEIKKTEPVSSAGTTGPTQTPKTK